MSQSRLYELLAQACSYPSAALEENISQCVEMLTPAHAEAAAEMNKFLQLVRTEGLGRLEEIYTAVFDLSPSCPPYAGYYLFGDTHKRGDFMVNLKKEFQAHDFDVKGEMPDHIAVLLEFMAVLDDSGAENDLVAECLVPALSEMEKSAPAGEGYHHIIRAVLMVLKKDMAAREAPALKNK